MHHQLQLMSSPLRMDTTLSQMAQLKDRMQKMEVSYNYARVSYRFVKLQGMHLTRME